MHGGWLVVKPLRKNRISEKGDDRMLGSSEFALELLKQAEENIKCQLSSKDLKKCIKEKIQKLFHKENIKTSLLGSGSRRKPLRRIRKELGVRLVSS